eukprot:2500318-Prorocentrum_lima.AAC.1
MRGNALQWQCTAMAIRCNARRAVPEDVRIQVLPVRAHVGGEHKHSGSRAGLLAAASYGAHAP